MKPRSWSLLRAIAVGCVLSLPGCGGGGGGSPTGPTTPPAPAMTVVAQGTFRVASVTKATDVCDILFFVPFTTSSAGRLDVTVDWSHATNDIDIFIEGGACTCTLAVAGQCTDLLDSQSATAKPETLSSSNLAAGSYTLVIGNAGASTEVGSYQVVLTH
jgi:hypothetical protein